jgi:hypothetical protein
VPARIVPNSSLQKGRRSTEIGLPLHSAATLLSEGLNPASSKAFSRSAGRQMSRLAAELAVMPSGSAAAGCLAAGEEGADGFHAA